MNVYAYIQGHLSVAIDIKLPRGTPTGIVFQPTITPHLAKASPRPTFRRNTGEMRWPPRPTTLSERPPAGSYWWQAVG